MSAMDKPADKHLFVADLIAQVALAMGIGLATSLVLAGAVLLLAGAA